MHFLRRQPPAAPQPPDVLQILQDVKQLLSNVATAQADLDGKINALSQQQLAIEAHFDARLDAIDAQLMALEGEVNPTIPFVSPSQYWSAAAMAIVTSINLAAGGSSDGVQYVDSSPTPQPFPGSQVVWSMPIGEASPSDLTVSLASDGFTFNFSAGSGAPTESVNLFATWTDPTGVQSPIVGSPLTVNIAAAVAPPPTFVAPGQYSETSGM